MALPYPIAPSQTDARSPVDDNLMDSIRLDLDYLDTVATQGGVPVYVWNVNGKLSSLSGRIAKRIDMQFLHVSQIFSRIRIAQEKSGISGVTEVDIRYHANPKTPITGISHQYFASTTSISQVAPAHSTLSIVRSTPQILTQSITKAKTQLNIQSIVFIESGLWRINLNAALDSDYSIGDSIIVAGATAGGNNGTFVIVEVNQSGYPSVVVQNPSGVAQNSATGTVDSSIWSYNLVNPADSSYVAGETAIFASHTNANNNGNKTVYKTNSGGNNIWVKNPTGVAQGTVTGNINTTRWVYSYAAPVSNFFAVGEFARFASHSLAANNGDFLVRAVNVGGNNITVTNLIGAAQGATAGTANTLRWKYAFGTDPSSQVSVGEKMIMATHTNANNNGIFTVTNVNDVTANNVIVYNPLGVAQAGAAGTVTHTKKLIKFASDQSLIYSTASYIEIAGTPDGTYRHTNSKLPFKVLEVNRGGGANYNVVIYNELGLEQIVPAGFVEIEARSIFSSPDGSKPQVGVDLLGLAPNGLLKATYDGANFNGVNVPAQTYLGLYILQIQSGAPENLSVMLT